VEYYFIAFFKTIPIIICRRANKAKQESKKSL